MTHLLPAQFDAVHLQGTVLVAAAPTFEVGAAVRVSVTGTVLETRTTALGDTVIVVVMQQVHQITDADGTDDEQSMGEGQ